MSPPARGRGLKQSYTFYTGFIRWVAPRAGAWIETKHISQRDPQDKVAPRAGAWIETSGTQSPVTDLCGRPPRGGVD